MVTAMTMEATRGTLSWMGLTSRYSSDFWTASSPCTYTQLLNGQTGTNSGPVQVIGNLGNRLKGGRAAYHLRISNSDVTPAPRGGSVEANNAPMPWRVSLHRARVWGSSKVPSGVALPLATLICPLRSGGPLRWDAGLDPRAEGAIFRTTVFWTGGSRDETKKAHWWPSILGVVRTLAIG